MDARPKISVVLPVRNAAASLGAALESVRAQTFADWELIVVNDGASDETAAILNKFAAAEPRIRVLIQPPLGIVRALKLGCAQARGACVARMDADDLMLPERLEKQFRFLEEHPGFSVVSSRVKYGGDVSLQNGYALHVEWVNSLLAPESMELRRFVESPVAHPSVMFRRSLLQRFGGYQEGDFPEDYELWLHWMDQGVRFAKLDEELLVWNDLPDRLSRADLRYCLDAFYRIKCHYLARWIRDHVELSREIWLWGAGRITRKRFRTLECEGIDISGFIDVDDKKIGTLPDKRAVVLPSDMPPARRSFIVAGVGSRGARDYICGCLEKAKRQEGRDFVLAA